MKYYLLIDLGFDGIVLKTFISKDEATKFIKEHIDAEKDKEYTEPMLLIKGKEISNYLWGQYDN